MAANVRAYAKGGFKLRNLLTPPIVAVNATIQTIARLNDTTPAGPASGFSYIFNGGPTLYSYTGSTLMTDAIGLSGNPISLVPFRPNASVQPWMYVGDTLKMDKVNSQQVCYKMGIEEPQIAPSVSFVPASDTVSLL